MNEAVPIIRDIHDKARDLLAVFEKCLGRSIGHDAVSEMLTVELFNARNPAILAFLPMPADQMVGLPDDLIAAMLLAEALVDVARIRHMAEIVLRQEGIQP